jgi:hypothetical protein
LAPVRLGTAMVEAERRNLFRLWFRWGIR